MNKIDYNFFQKQILKLNFGKKLKNTVYIYSELLSNCSERFLSFVEDVREKIEIGKEYNVLKFVISDFKMSFLAYPDFFKNPHPVLQSSITVNITTGRTRTSDY